MKNKPARSVKLLLSGEMHEYLEKLATQTHTTVQAVAHSLLNTGLAFLAAEAEMKQVSEADPFSVETLSQEPAP